MELFLALVEQICPRRTEIYNLWTTVSVFFEPRALVAVKGVRDALAATDDALSRIVSKRAFIAYPNERSRPHVGIADGTFSVAFVAQAADGDAGLLSTHDEVWMMLAHGGGWGRVLTGSE